MNEQDLDIRFQEAVKQLQNDTSIFATRCSTTSLCLLQTCDFGALESRQTSTYHLRDAFKMNV
jgi:hypothetical protein